MPTVQSGVVAVPTTDSERSTPGGFWARLFPPTGNLPEAQRCITYGVGAAALCGSVTLIAAVVSIWLPFLHVIGIDPSALTDAFAFLLIAIGLRRRSRLVACVGLGLYLVEFVATHLSAPNAGMGVSLVMVCGFVNGVRGTLAYHRLSPGEPRSRWSHSLRAAGWILLLIVVPLVGLIIGQSAVALRDALRQQKAARAKAYSPTAATAPELPPLLHPVDLGHGVKISLPHAWVVEDARKLKDPFFFSASLSDASGHLLAHLNMQDDPDVRISQAESSELTTAEVQQFADSVHTSLEKAARNGLTLLDWRGSRIERVGGRLALRSVYRARIRPGMEMETNSLLFFLGTHGVTMTLMYNANAGAAAKQAFDEVFRSFRVAEDSTAR